MHEEVRHTLCRLISAKWKMEQRRNMHNKNMEILDQYYGGFYFKLWNFIMDVRQPFLGRYGNWKNTFATDRLIVIIIIIVKVLIPITVPIIIIFIVIYQDKQLGHGP